MTIREKIDALVKAGWSYRKLAKIAGVSRTSISRWHKGVCEPTLRNKHKIEKVYMLMQKGIYFPNNGDHADALNYFMMHPIIGNVVGVGLDEHLVVGSTVLSENCLELLNKLGDPDAKIDDQIKLLEDELAKLKAQKEAEKWKFTEDEKVILRNLSKEFCCIARDEDGNLWLYKEKPHKNIDFIIPDKIWVGGGEYIDFTIYNHLFQCIQWSDEEPCEFRKFI